MSSFEQSVAGAIEGARYALDQGVGLGSIRHIERDDLAMLIEAAAGPGVEARSKASIAATRASEGVFELLKFAREGNQMATTAFAISVAENLADSIRLAIDAQGGPEDEDEAQFYAAVTRYLDGPAALAPRECALSPDGKHQVDTSMESGPNNCFHCEKPMKGDIA